jgi:hypothetical protein
VKARARATGLAAFVLATLLAAVPARADVFSGLLGEAPADTGRHAPTAGQSLDTLDVGRNADRALVHPGDQVASFAGGDQVRTGVPGIVRPWLVGGPGYGRLPLVLDGFPVGQGVVHWDNPAWFPVRALDHLGLAGGAGALLGDGGAGRVLSGATFRGPVRPASVVSLLGGSFGHRLAELDFARQFGPVGFHADVADYGHDGFGPVGRTDAARGFARLDFPMFGFTTTLGIGIAAGTMEAFGALDEGTESTDESSFSLRATRGAWDLRLLRESSRLEIEALVAESFRLTRGRWWGEAARDWRGGRATWRLAAFGSLEERSGVLDDEASFASGGVGLGVSRPAFGSALAGARLRVLRAEPTGVDVEGGLSLEDAPPAGLDRERGWWLEASRTRLVPAILLHQDQPLADRERTAEILGRIESLDTAERTWRVGAGAAVGGAFRVGVEVAALGQEGRLPWLSAAPGAPLGPATDEWSGEARVAVRWRPATTLDMGVAAGGATFHADAHPFRPRFTADGWVRLARNYFQRDLTLSGELRGHLIGERTNPDGAIYPTLLSADGILTAEIKAVTLFVRFDNLTDLFIESDWRDPDFPLALPGVSTRLGATLRLVD